MIAILWTIRSFEGVGPLSFGLTRADVRSILNEAPRSFRKVTWAQSLTDDYPSHCLHAYFDSNDRLEFIEFYEPARISFRGETFFGRAYVDVERTLRNWDPDIRTDRVGLVSCKFGISIYVEDRIQGVGAFCAEQIPAYCC